MNLRLQLIIAGVVIVTAGALIYRYVILDRIIFDRAEITPSAVNICPEQTQQFSVKVFDVDGRDVTTNAPAAAWNITNTTVATENGGGLVTAVLAGTTELNVSFPGTTIEPDSANVSVCSTCYEGSCCEPTNTQTACSNANLECGPVDAGCGVTASCGECQDPRLGPPCTGEYVQLLACSCIRSEPSECQVLGGCNCYAAFKCGKQPTANCSGGGVKAVIAGSDPPTLINFECSPGLPCGDDVQNDCACPSPGGIGAE